MPIGIQQQGGYQPQSYNAGPSNWSNFFLGSGPSIQQIPTVTPEVSQALSQILQQALGGLQNPSQGFAPIAQDAQRNFQQNIVPSIAERFSGLGAQRSSAFGQQLGSAGAGLASNLASQQAQYGLQNRQGLLSQFQLGSMPQFENAYNPGQSGFLSQLLSGLVGGGLSAGTGGLSALTKGSVKNYLAGA
jgi:hypothetical protein